MSTDNNELLVITVINTTVSFYTLCNDTLKGLAIAARSERRYNKELGTVDSVHSFIIHSKSATKVINKLRVVSNVDDNITCEQLNESNMVLDGHFSVHLLENKKRVVDPREYIDSTKMSLDRKHLSVVNKDGTVE